MYPFQHDADRKMTAFANKYQQPSEMERRILNQLARELLLAQSSDWAFQIYQGTTVEYSSRRFQSHIHRFDMLGKMLDSGPVDEDILNEIENRDSIFQEIDYRTYQS